MEKGQWFLRAGERFWRCGHCGKILVVVMPPKQCVVCGKRNSFFAENVKTAPDVLDRDNSRS